MGMQINLSFLVNINEYIVNHKPYFEDLMVRFEITGKALLYVKKRPSFEQGKIKFYQNILNKEYRANCDVYVNDMFEFGPVIP